MEQKWRWKSCLFHVASMPSQADRVVGRAPEVSEARTLLSEIVVREMRGCAVVLLYDTPDALTPLPSALLHHPYGLSLIYLTSLDAASALELKVRLLHSLSKHWLT